MRRGRGSTCKYVQRDDLEPRARRSGAPARQAGGAATRAAQPPQPHNPSNSQHTATAQIGPKLGRNIEHWWYNGSPANRSTAIPRSLAISQDIYLWLQGSHSARGHSGLKQTLFPARSSAGWSTLRIRATLDVARRVTRPKSEIWRLGNHGRSADRSTLKLGRIVDYGCYDTRTK